MTREELWKNLVKAGYHCYEKGTTEDLMASYEARMRALA